MSHHTNTEILFVEDNPCDAELALNVLRKHHASIVHVTDGQQALDWLFDNRSSCSSLPNMVLLDLKLPKVNGIEVLRAIRSEPRTRLLPVVIMTSSNQESDVVECYNLGANSYIVKSLDFHAFSASIAQLGHYWLHMNEAPTKSPPQIHSNPATLHLPATPPQAS